LDVDLTQTEIKARLKKVKMPVPRYTMGVMAKYARHVSSASEGAITT
jgi:dihydroxy-acid dehydratase